MITDQITPDQRSAILGEKARVARMGRIRQFVFGSLDGLLVPLGVVSGVAGGTGDARAVIVAGLAEAFAGAVSMGAGEFLSSRAEAQVQQAEVAAKLREVEDDPQHQIGEMIVVLESEGLAPDDARAIAERLCNSLPAYQKTLVEKELGLDVAVDTARVTDALVMGVSYMVASIAPLISYFFLPLQSAYPASLALTLVVLIAIGAYRGRLARVNLLRSALEVVVVGVVSGLGGYLLGTWLPHLVGY